MSPLSPSSHEAVEKVLGRVSVLCSPLSTGLWMQALGLGGGQEAAVQLLQKGCSAGRRPSPLPTRLKRVTDDRNYEWGICLGSFPGNCTGCVKVFPEVVSGPAGWMDFDGLGEAIHLQGLWN